MIELSDFDKRRIAERVHPDGLPVPELECFPQYSQFKSIGHDRLFTRRLGVVTEWKRDGEPEVYADPDLNLYSWSFTDPLMIDGRTFIPGRVVDWAEPARIEKGRKPWQVTLLAVATEHVERVLTLRPGLMVRLYNGTKAFALPAEVEL